MRNERQIRCIEILDMIIMFLTITTFNVFMEKSCAFIQATLFLDRFYEKFLI